MVDGYIWISESNKNNIIFNFLSTNSQNISWVIYFTKIFKISLANFVLNSTRFDLFGSLSVKFGHFKHYKFVVVVAVIRR